MKTKRLAVIFIEFILFTSLFLSRTPFVNLVLFLRNFSSILLLRLSFATFELGKDSVSKLDSFICT